MQVFAILIQDPLVFGGLTSPLWSGIGSILCLLIVLLSIRWSERNRPGQTRR